MNKLFLTIAITGLLAFSADKHMEITGAGHVKATCKTAKAAQKDHALAIMPGSTATPSGNKTEQAGHPETKAEAPVEAVQKPDGFTRISRFFRGLRYWKDGWDMLMAAVADF